MERSYAGLVWGNKPQRSMLLLIHEYRTKEEKNDHTGKWVAAAQNAA